MLLGVPTEIKNHEYRVGLTPSSVRELIAHGHQVLVQSGAGLGSGFSDEEYVNLGATLAASAADVFNAAEMIVKVKEPQPEECRQLKPGQLLFTYLHLAADREQAELLVASGASAVAYETVTDKNGALPLLAPMSEVAGRLSIQAGARCLEKAMGGSGVLLGGVPGVAPGKVVIIGGGTVGHHAAQMAVGLGADVTIVDRSLSRLRELNEFYGARARCLYADTSQIEALVTTADLVIGAVLIPGASAPKLVTRAMLKRMRPGSVLVDVAIDQGGCFETSHPTTHAEPTFVVDELVHYCVANMPGAVPRTSTEALNHATLPYVLKLADDGLDAALAGDAGLADGLNVHRGHITSEPVAQALGMPADKFHTHLAA